MSTVDPSAGLGKDAFLQLLVTQMQYQDPLQPQDGTQFVAQLAQFTSLEQMTNIAQTENSALQSLNGILQVTQLSAVHTLLGASVEVKDGAGQTVSGVVTGVRFVQGEPQLVIDGQTYPLSALVGLGS